MSQYRDRRFPWDVAGILFLNVSNEPLSEAMDGADESGIICAVVEDPPDFGDEASDVRVLHEGGGPYMLQHRRA
jgi:hypothetical protein